MPIDVHNTGLEASLVVFNLMKASNSEQRRNIIHRNMDMLREGLKPFLKRLVVQAPEERLKIQACLNGMVFSSEVSREMSLSGRLDDAKTLAQQDLEWLHQTLSNLARVRDEKLAGFVADLGIIHANQYRRLGMADIAFRAFLIVDPVFEALEIAEQQLVDRQLAEEALIGVVTAQLMLKDMGFEESVKHVEDQIGKLNLAPSELNKLRQEAKKRVADYWLGLPEPSQYDGLNANGAFPFRSIKVARSWALGLSCPQCDGKLTLVAESVERSSKGELYMTFRLRCSGSCQIPAVLYNHLPSVSFLSLASSVQLREEDDKEGGLTTRQYIDLMRSSSPYPLAELDVIEPMCTEALTNAQKIIPKTLGQVDGRKIHVEVGVRPGVSGLQTSPFPYKCRDGFAIMVPEIFVIRLFRFARHLAQTWGVTNGVSRTVDPVLKGERARTLSQMLYREFWEVELSSRPIEILEHMGPLLVAILENCLTFAIAHELAHIYLGHVGQRHYISLSDESEDVPALIYRQKDEIQADKMASQLLQQMVREQSKDELLEALAMASVDIFFTLLTLIEHKFPPDPRQHPPASVRRAALRSQVGIGVSGESLLFAIAAQHALETDSDEPLDSLDLPEEVRGNWQTFELSLHSLALGDKVGSLAHLTQFLIRDPVEEEGWNLLRHLLLADRSDKVMLLPRNAIPVYPEIRHDEIVIRVAETLTNPASGREVERKVWMKYAMELTETATSAGGLEALSLQNEVEALSHFILQCVYVPGLDRSRGIVSYLSKLEEQGLLPVFTYFARFSSFDRPGFIEFQERLLRDSSEVRALFQALVMVETD